MKTVTCAALLLCLGSVAADAQEITSRASMGVALTPGADVTLRRDGGLPSTGVLTTDTGFQGAYAIEFSIAGDAALQVGLSATHVRTHFTAGTSASSPPSDGLNLTTLSIGVAYHIPAKGWDTHITPFAAVTAPTMLVFEHATGSTTSNIAERWTWGIEGGVARDLGRSPFAVDFSLRYTDLRLRLNRDVSGRLPLRPLVLSIGLVYRH